MFRKVSIASRMFLLVAFMALFSLVVGIAFSYYMKSVAEKSLQETESVMHQGYERSLKMAVDSFATQLSKVHAQTKKEGGDAELAMRMGVRHARFDGQNYFFMYDLTGKTIALPLTPELYGTNRYDLKDNHGTYFVRDIIKTTKAGGGFVVYWYPKPGEEEASPKKAYVAPIEGTNLLIGTGVYIDDIDVELARMTGKFEGILSNAQYSVGIGVGVVFLFLILPLAYFLVRSILNPLKNITHNTREVAEGNLDVKVKVTGRDEITHLESALDLMVHKLADNVREIKIQSEAAEQKARDAESAMADAQQARIHAEKAKSAGMHAAAEKLEVVVEHVSAAANAIARQTEEIRRGAENQSTRIAETATAMEEMNATVLEVAKNSGEAAGVGTQSLDKARSGAEIVRQSIEEMGETQEKTLQLKQNMAQLGQQAEAIGNIMNVIEDIADQTNLLALNAAIEAARAGEAGRGFAVVADEVRKLAEKTMGATKEVGESIRSIQEGARSNIESVEIAAKDMEKVVELSNRSGSMLDEIVQGVENSSGQIQSIATAAEEQSATSEQINQSIDEINRITQQTSQGVVQTSGTVSELSNQMTVLGNLIQELKAS